MGRTMVTGEMHIRDGTSILTLDGRPFCALEHIGDGEFRLRGWSDERTLQVDGTSGTVVMRFREGGSTYAVDLPRMGSGESEDR